MDRIIVRVSFEGQTRVVALRILPGTPPEDVDALVKFVCDLYAPPRRPSTASSRWSRRSSTA